MISVFEDSSFEPISSKELPRLSVAVSLLVHSALDWTNEKHGIIIDFTHNGFSGNGTFLPEVASRRVLGPTHNSIISDYKSWLQRKRL